MHKCSKVELARALKHHITTRNWPGEVWDGKGPEFAKKPRRKGSPASRGPRNCPECSNWRFDRRTHHCALDSRPTNTTMRSYTSEPCPDFDPIKKKNKKGRAHGKKQTA